MSGLVNYYGRAHESDNIKIKPVLLQKGRTKLALYGMSNVRDERLFRTFRDGKVKFFKPTTQGPDWFNIMSVHQNRHAYTETGYLPETFLPDFLDLVVWGHEHECLIHPRQSAEAGFDVMQPGSSIATSLDKTEAVPKYVAIVSVTGRDYRVEPVRLKTVRPFKMKEIVLADDPVAKKLIRKDDHRTELTRRLAEHVEGLIEEAHAEWRELQEEEHGDGADEPPKPPRPLIRLRVEYTPPEGATGAFDCENPQRFSNRFRDRVANTTDVVQFHKRKAAARRGANTAATMPDDIALNRAAALDSIKVDRLVREFLKKQSLTILPQNSFSEAVAEFVEKDDPHAMEFFVTTSLRAQVQHLLDLDPEAEEDEEEARRELLERITANKARMEEQFGTGQLRFRNKARLKEKPDMWDSDIDGHWADQPGALRYSDVENEAEEDAEEAPAPAKGRGRASAGAKKATGTARGAASKRTAAATKKAAPAAKSTRGRKKQVEEEEDEDEDEDEDGDIIMGDDDVEDDEDGEQPSQPLFVDSPPRSNGRKPAAKPAPKPAPRTTTRAAAAATPAKRQTKLALTPASQSQASSRATGTGRGARRAAEVIEDDDDDDDDGAFEPATTQKSRRR